MRTNDPRLRAAALFIDRLADLIPAKHLNDSSAQVDVRYLKKAERERTITELKEQHAIRKRSMLDPDDGNGSLASDALRVKLQKRLEEMRKKRKADELQEKVKCAREWKSDALDVGRKKAAGQQRQARQKLSKANARTNTSDKKGPKPRALQAEPRQGNDFSFSKMEFDGQPEFKRRGSKKPSKQDLLEQIEKDQHRVLTKAEEKARAWRAALARVHGEKVLDDPRLLRRSLKKTAKSFEKKQKAWTERVEKVKEQHKQKQHRRKANLQARATGKRERKIQRREKKLTGGGNRAGFEGRKSTPIK